MYLNHVLRKFISIIGMALLLFSCKTQPPCAKHSKSIYYTFPAEAENILIYYLDSISDKTNKSPWIISMMILPATSEFPIRYHFNLQRADYSFNKKIEPDSVIWRKEKFIITRTHRFVSLKNGKYIIPLLLPYDGAVGMNQLEYPLNNVSGENCNVCMTLNENLNVIKAYWIRK